MMIKTMRWHRHRRTEKRIARLFSEGLSGRETRRLSDTLDACPTCAAVYTRYHALESALSGTAGTTSRFAVERVAHGLFDAVESRPVKRRVSVLKWAGGFATAAVVAIGLMLFGPSSPRSHRIALSETGDFSSRELVPRGSSNPGNAHIGIRVFAVGQTQGALREGTALFLDDVITFTYTYATDAPGYLMLLGLQEESETPLWYYPDLGEGRSIPIDGDSVDEPLGDGIVLSVNHQVGLIRIVALFSDAPISTAAVEAAADSLRAAGRLLDVGAPLPLDGHGIDAIQYAILLKIEASHETNL